MVAPPPFPRATAPPPLQNGFGDDRVLGLVRDTRAEAQNLERILDEIHAATILNPDVRAEQVVAVIRASQPLFEQNRAAVADRLLKLRAAMEADAELYQWYGDEVTTIENAWERATTDWPIESLSVSDVQNRIERVRAWLRDMIYHAGFITIPDRTNHRLRHLRVGQSLDFYENFKDEMPLADLDRILVYLHAHPNSVEGRGHGQHAPHLYHAYKQHFFFLLQGNGFCLTRHAQFVQKKKKKKKKKKGMAQLGLARAELDARFALMAAELKRLFAVLEPALKLSAVDG